MRAINRDFISIAATRRKRLRNAKLDLRLCSPSIADVKASTDFADTNWADKLPFVQQILSRKSHLWFILYANLCKWNKKVKEKNISWYN